MITELVVCMYWYDYESMSLTTLFYSGTCLQASEILPEERWPTPTFQFQSPTLMASNQRETFIKSYPFIYNLSGGKNIWEQATCNSNLNARRVKEQHSGSYFHANNQNDTSFTSCKNQQSFTVSTSMIKRKFQQNAYEIPKCSSMRNLSSGVQIQIYTYHSKVGIIDLCRVAIFTLFALGCEL